MAPQARAGGAGAGDCGNREIDLGFIRGDCFAAGILEHGIVLPGVGFKIVNIAVRRFFRNVQHRDR